MCSRTMDHGSIRSAGKANSVRVVSIPAVDGGGGRGCRDCYDGDVTLPLTFDPYGWHEHLTLREITPELTEARWEAAGLTVRFGPREPIIDDWHLAPPTRESMRRLNPELTYLGKFGFVLGDLCEVFVVVSTPNDPWAEKPEPFSFTLANFEGSIGQATPVAHVLFEDGHVDHIDGEFEWLTTLRLRGSMPQEVEALVLSALVSLRQRRGLAVRPVALGDVAESTYGLATDTPVSALGPGYRDLEPLRFLFRAGDEQRDDASFLHAYRALEYFWSFNDAHAVEALRAAASLSTHQFIKRIEPLVKPSEGPALGRLVETIASAEALELALNEQLISSRTHSALATALYAFRNSLVHAKTTGKPFLSESIFESNTTIRSWRRVCELLARAALHRFGTPL